MNACVARSTYGGKMPLLVGVAIIAQILSVVEEVGSKRLELLDWKQKMNHV
jgi:hypothetical protein